MDDDVIEKEMGHNGNNWVNLSKTFKQSLLPEKYRFCMSKLENEITSWPSILKVSITLFTTTTGTRRSSACIVPDKEGTVCLCLSAK